MSLKETFVEELENVLNMVGGKDGSRDKLYITRKNVSDSLTKGEQGFGFISFIRSDQAVSGRYSGLSIKVNPGENHYRISLDIGNEGFGDDYQLATLPGTRRRFLNLQRNIISYSQNQEADIKSFCSLEYGDDAPKRQLKDLEKEYKADNIDSHPQDLFVAFAKKPELTEEIRDQSNNQEDFWLIFKAVVAIYAELRQWSNKGETKIANKFIRAVDGDHDGSQDVSAYIQQLLKHRQYVVLQGAPGTGKTYLMSKLSENYKPYFTQFHAETTYSDFVGGYRPITNNGQLSYQYFEGPLLKAIRAAKENDSQKVLLMIDEINRANLSNVLGEAFYLFEKQAGERRAKVQLGDPQNPISIEALPSNLYVIATMNTADRSLAVVDFALRRRFAWYTMQPHALKPAGNQTFHAKQFEAMDRIFQTYATSEELMLEPGQAYYLTDSENANALMNDRMQYELLPLIREYLENGLMTQAKDALNQYFVDELNQTLFI
ncbi:AAA domain-containing protein [Lactobacillus sp. LC28-10]|uniref:AAA domain-containing protein n=1 Tax=Secundilactobacillus angelensis TaxID=2722706 RepID=A0ABX1KU34_9LACO|nr:AAA family ATPase [Secundilactobacillus angelensis]MCH5461943.1 AAA family ATPase [Secundilactobacillus angelensis]NLR17431.1 AAA domain-containing protein [Secundilactobacillus angelensis]